jgi:membrane-associated protease RseP (regulator of RpoE activity)
MSQATESVPSFLEVSAPARLRNIARPSASEWARHLALFALTVITTTIAGVMLISPNVEPAIRPPAGVFGYLLFLPQYYLASVAALMVHALSNPPVLLQGVLFSASLLAILATHEAGHYIACRRYGVDATLPFFLPAPPLFLAGTFGAFIKIKAPIPSRRALFDIGLAGPLAGFAVALPIAIAGIATLQVVPPVSGPGITFNDPLLFRLLALIFNVNLNNGVPNPFYMAAWIGLLVTALNLMPVSQLDGGHGTFALFGPSAHKIIGRAAFVTMAVLAVLGWTWHGSPSGFLYAVLLGVMLRVRHPQPREMQPLGRARIAVALITLLVFALSYWPFPITIT